MAAILLRVWGRNGRPPTFDTKKPVARPALTGVAKNLTWVGLLEIGLALAFAFGGPAGWLTSGILGTVGLGLLYAARRVAAKSEKTGGNDPIYPLVHKEFVPLGYMNRIQIGDRLPVKIDPLDSASLVIEWDRLLQPSM